LRPTLIGNGKAVHMRRPEKTRRARWSMSR
jgi:hypothetical protein